MARLVFGMNESLDGYVDHMAFAPSPTLFRHFIEEAQGQAGTVYGRHMYEVMRYWDDNHPSHPFYRRLNRLPVLPFRATFRTSSSAHGTGERDENGTATSGVSTVMPLTFDLSCATKW